MGQSGIRLYGLYLIVLLLGRFTLFDQTLVEAQQLKTDGGLSESATPERLCTPCPDSTDTIYNCRGDAVVKCSKPVVSLSPSDVVKVESGDIIELKCNANGYPMPKIDWHHNGCKVNTRDGIEIKETSGQSHLVIQKARCEDTGKYTCNAINQVGKATAETLVDVKPRLCENCVQCGIQELCTDSIRHKVASYRDGHTTTAVTIYSCDHTREYIGLAQLAMQDGEMSFVFYPLREASFQLSFEMTYSTDGFICTQRHQKPSYLLPKTEPCLGSEERCRRIQIATATECAALNTFCLNDLDTFIQNVTSHVRQNAVPFVSSEYLVLTRQCDSFGYAVGRALKGIIVTNVSEKTMQHQSRLEVRFYEQEPKRRMWIFTADITTTGSTTANLGCSGVSEVRDIPVFYMPRPSPTVTFATCPTYMPTTAITQEDGGFDALKKDESDENCPGSSLAIAACASFVAGVLTVLTTLFLLRCLRTHKRCLRKNDEAGSKTKEGASQNVTKQVLQKYNGEKKLPQPTHGDKKIYSQLGHDNDTGQHVYDISQDTYETLKSDGPKDTHVYSAAQSTYQCLDEANGVKYNTGNEHVYTGLDGQSGSDNSRGEPPTTQNGHADQRSESLFDDSRDSSASAHNYFTLQNNNFRLSEPQRGGHRDTSTGNRESNDGNAYFVLEKKGDSGPDAKMPPQDGGTDNTYFVLEKEGTSGAKVPQQTSGTDNTHCVLEKEASKQQVPDKAEDNDNNYFVLEKQ